MGMSKEEAERLAKVETQMEAIQKERESWQQLFRETTAQTVKYLLAMGLAGVIFGWQLPENVRKWLADWIAR